MTESRAELARTETPQWFCLRTQPKQEHLAAASLRRQLEISVFAPRVRYKKATQRGPVWFVEAMFPNYLFARFVYPLLHRRVEHSSGITGIVRFGEQVATVHPRLIETLRGEAGDEEVVTYDPEIKVGDSVRIAEGPFQGIEALVTRLLPAKERVRVLLEFLGRIVETEVSRPQILPATSRPR